MTRDWENFTASKFLVPAGLAFSPGMTEESG